GCASWISHETEVDGSADALHPLKIMRRTEGEQRQREAPVRGRFPLRRLRAELLAVLAGESLPAVELHRLDAGNTADRVAIEQVVEYVEADVPSRGAHGHPVAIDVGPERESCAVAIGCELPSEISAAPVELEHLGRFGSLHFGFDNLGRRRSERAELHGFSRDAQVPVGIVWRPFAQLRRVGDRLPYLLGGMVKVADEHERPLLAFFALNPRPSGRTRHVLLSSGHHRFLLDFGFRGGGSSMRSRWRSSASMWVDQKRLNCASQSSTSCSGSGLSR